MEDKEYTIEQLLSNPSFVRWIEGDLNRQEAEYWNRWVAASEQNRQLARQAQQKISGFAFDVPELPDIQDEWDKVQHDIEQPAGLKFLPRAVYGKNSRDFLSIFFKVAAVLLVGAFVGLTAYMYQEPASKAQDVAEHTIQTDYGEKRTINFSDGSTIILAAGSKISYKENWLEKPVQQLSLEGEALFDIAPQKTKEHPKLIVETEDGSASVWGTRFTVDTYGVGTQVVLEEGEVRIHAENGMPENEQAETTINAGEMAQFGESDGIELRKVNPKVYTSWSTNKLFFDNTPLSILVNRIERTYGVDVEVKDPEILNRNLSGSVDFRSLDGLIAAISEIFEIQIQRSGEILIIKQ